MWWKLGETTLAFTNAQVDHFTVCRKSQHRPPANSESDREYTAFFEDLEGVIAKYQAKPRVFLVDSKTGAPNGGLMDPQLSHRYIVQNSAGITAGWLIQGISAIDPL